MVRPRGLGGRAGWNEDSLQQRGGGCQESSDRLAVSGNVVAGGGRSGERHSTVAVPLLLRPFGERDSSVAVPLLLHLASGPERSQSGTATEQGRTPHPPSRALPPPRGTPVTAP